MPEMAKQIKIKRDRRSCELIIDGKPFAWLIAENGISIDNVGRVPTVTLTLLADEIDLSNTL